MASIVLGVAGSFLAGPVGGAVGALVGGWLDRSYILPGLFPAGPVEGPRLTELKLQGMDEGHPANWLIGGSYRFAGEVIWASVVREIKVEEDSGGGKGGGGGGSRQTIGYEYRCDIAVAVVSPGPITSIEKVLGSGRQIYNAHPDISVTSSLIGVQVKGSGSHKRQRVTSGVGGPDLSQFVAGYNVVVSGFANGTNNGTFKCLGTSKDKAAGTSYVELKNSACVGESAGAAATLSQTGLPTFDPSQLDAVTVYLGTAGQGIDPTIETAEGTGTVPAFRDTAYVVLKNLLLGPFGNIVPQFGFMATDTASNTYPLAIAEVLARSGRSSSEWDVSRLTGAMDGYGVSGPQSLVQVLQPLLLAGDILAQDRSGVFTWFHRKDAPVIEVEAAHLSAHEGGSDAPRNAEVGDLADAPIPSEVDVRYVDLESEQQSGATNERRRSFTSDGIVPVDLPIVMKQAKARAIARRLLYSAAANRTTVTVQLLPRYAFVQENDCLRLTAIAVPLLLLVQKVDEGANGLIVCECIVEARDALTQTEVAEAPYTPTTPNQTTIYDTSGVLAELPPITASGSGFANNAPLIQGVACLLGINTPWKGVEIFWSDDDSVFAPIGVLDQEGTQGSANTVLNGTGILPMVWDLVSTVDVELDNGSLSSATELDVLNGANRALIGDEIIGFQVATLIGERQYRLSKLMRGLRDTMDAMTTHALGDRFVLLNSAVVEKAVSLGSMNTTRYVRFVPGGGALANVASDVVTITGKSLRPFSAGGATGIRDAAGRITATWTRRTRAVTRLFSSTLVPLHERSESYSIDIVWPAGSGTIKRTISATSPTAVYSDANQGTDGVTPFTPVEFRIYQISEVYGRGKPLIQVL